MGDSKKLTPGGNWLWEDSRMFLPEHANAVRQYKKELERRGQKFLAEDEWSDISHLFGESNVRKMPIKIRLYDPFEQLTVIGVVERVDNGAGRFMVEGEWFEMGKVEGAAACQEREGDEYYG